MCVQMPLCLPSRTASVSILATPHLCKRLAFDACVEAACGDLASPKMVLHGVYIPLNALHRYLGQSLILLRNFNYSFFVSFSLSLLLS